MRANRFWNLLLCSLVGLGLAACDSDSPTDLEDQDDEQEQQSTDDIVGAWTAVVDDTHIVVAFLADGTYVHIEDGPSDDAGQSGIEKGTYDWDPATGDFVTTCPSVDTNGQWGLSHPDGDAGCTGQAPQFGVKVTVDETTFEIDHGEGDVFTLTRVDDSDESIVGAWFTVEGDTEILVALLANGTYVHAEAGPSDEAGQTGMERGSYSWEASSGAFTSTCPVEDTNGQWGLSHPDPDAGCTGITAEMEVTVTVDGGTMQFGSVEGDSLTLARVTP